MSDSLPKPPAGIHVRQVIGPKQAAACVAEELVDVQVACLAAGRRCVLGLATGRSMLEVYSALVEKIQQGQLKGSEMTSFNLDEYCGLGPEDPRLFASFVREHWARPAGLDPASLAFPDVRASAEGLEQACSSYEEKIVAAGGMDVLYLGLGRNGHIAFNEPGSSRESLTRLVDLAAQTRIDAAVFFGSLEQVPSQAVTMGIATIQKAQRIRVLAFGEAKRAAVASILAGRVREDWPCTHLLGHPDVQLYVDAAAAGS